MAADLFEVENESDDAKAPTIVLRVQLHPGAGPTAVLGRHGDALALRVAPPPSDARANQAVRTFLAELLSVPEGDLELVGGEKAREKRFKTTGIDAAVLRRQLDDEIDRVSRARKCTGEPRRPVIYGTPESSGHPK